MNKFNNNDDKFPKKETLEYSEMTQWEHIKYCILQKPVFSKNHFKIWNLVY